MHKLFVALMRRKASARTQFGGCSSTTNAHSETGQMAACCQNLPLGALSSRSAPSVLIGELFKSSVFFWKRFVYLICIAVQPPCKLRVCQAAKHYKRFYTTWPSLLVVAWVVLSPLTHVSLSSKDISHFPWEHFLSSSSGLWHFKLLCGNKFHYWLQ